MLRERAPTSDERSGRPSSDLMRALLWALQADLYGNQYGSQGLWGRAKVCVENAKALLESVGSGDTRWLETNWLLREVEGMAGVCAGRLRAGAIPVPGASE